MTRPIDRDTARCRFCGDFVGVHTTSEGCSFCECPASKAESQPREWPDNRADEIRQARVQSLQDGAEAIELVMNDPDRRRPRNGELPTDYANDIEWAVIILKNLADELKKEPDRRAEEGRVTAKEQWWCGAPTTDGLGCILPHSHEAKLEDHDRTEMHLSIAQRDDGVTIPVPPERAAMFPPTDEDEEDY